MDEDAEVGSEDEAAGVQVSGVFEWCPIVQCRHGWTPLRARAAQLCALVAGRRRRCIMRIWFSRTRAWTMAGWTLTPALLALWRQRWIRWSGKRSWSVLARG